jgi:hypothetical protein
MEAKKFSHYNIARWQQKNGTDMYNLIGTRVPNIAGENWHHDHTATFSVADLFRAI